MPKHIVIESEIERLRKAPPHTLSQYTARIPSGLALELAYIARASNQQMSRALLDVLEKYLIANRDGCVLHFDPDIRRQLDAAATALGVDRESLVRRIIGENLSRYLQQAVVAQAERRDAERTLREVQLDTEAAATAVKPPKPKK